MRSENSIKSVITATITSIVTILIGFITQSIFVKILGNEYLGINGLYTNILSMLAIAELGFGSAIIVNLYRPVAKGNIEKIKTLMYFYKTIYRIIAIIVAVLGIIILPFLKYIVGYISININLQLIFILYLADTVISYLLTYKRSILQANQKNYIINIVHFGYVVIMNILQIIYLLAFKEFIGYLIIKIICRLLENIIISIIADKKYSYIKSKDVKPVSKRLKKSIYIRVKGLLFHKIGSFIVLGSDNIIISMTKTLGVGVVGLYSNYYMIINALNNLFSQIFTSLTASVGNLLVEANNQKNKLIYKSTLLLNSWLYSFAAISMFFISVPFVKIWLGNEYVLSQAVVLTLVINFYINGMRRTYATFKEAAGVFYEDRYVPVIESVTGFTNEKLGTLFPILFVTVACGAVSGFHSLVSSGTSSKTIENEKDMTKVGYGAMVLESLLAVLALCVAGAAASQDGTPASGTPFQIFSRGVAGFFEMFGIPVHFATVFMTMCVSALALTSLDAVARIGRMSFQELFAVDDMKNAKPWRKVLCNPYFSTIITLLFGFVLTKIGYANIWPLFGSANQLLSALVLITLCVFMKVTGRSNKMLFPPMIIMLCVTFTALVQRLIAMVKAISTAAAVTIPAGETTWGKVFLNNGLQLVIAVLLIVLGLTIVINSMKSYVKSKKSSEKKEEKVNG